MVHVTLFRLAATAPIQNGLKPSVAPPGATGPLSKVGRAHHDRARCLACVVLIALQRTADATATGAVVLPCARCGKLRIIRIDGLRPVEHWRMPAAWPMPRIGRPGRCCGRSSGGWSTTSWSLTAAGWGFRRRRILVRVVYRCDVVPVIATGCQDCEDDDGSHRSTLFGLDRNRHGYADRNRSRRRSIHARMRGNWRSRRGRWRRRNCNRSYDRYCCRLNGVVSSAFHAEALVGFHVRAAIAAECHILSISSSN